MSYRAQACRFLALQLNTIKVKSALWARNESISTGKQALRFRVKQLVYLGKLNRNLYRYIISPLYTQSSGTEWPHGNHAGVARAI